ncbi:MAG: ABC transporter ATP-binding protein [Anaerolineaceae bacterium]|nr:ABC transporter ATP-binding protein [Anaerolineaceae bacterium]MDI9531467.1 ABC transporter ATP-binding protein [Chloroflexota bacterium]NLE92943.1 ABC transporter ATP-binding protein [Chloroflexota bacterium]HOF28432.1 ABC transporter ATP-binding protein [Anaerolineaceae bacterium]
MNTLTLENVSYSYKASQRKALDDINATFQNGKVYAVTGPSGSGKTTLLSILAGLDTPTEGEVYIYNEKLSALDLDQYRREQVSMIFQAFHLFPTLNVMENVSFPMELNGIERDEARTRSRVFLNSVGITDEKHKRFPTNLSGGEQQRVAIARTMASGARILLADEPTGNLDKENGQKIVDILKVLAHENGYCVIIVTHDLEIARQADQVWKMEDGRMTSE